MPIFAYKAIDPTTLRCNEGRLEAPNMRAAKDQLRESGQLPQLIEEQVDSGSDVMKAIPLIGPMLASQVGLKALSFFTIQLATLLDAGIPLIESLLLLEQQTSNKALSKILYKVRTDIIGGDSFSGSLGRFPDTFNSLYLSMIQAGELSGSLDRICRRLAELQEKLMSLKNKLFLASVYPVVSLVLILGIVEAVLIFLVPQFAGFYSDRGAELFWGTQMLVHASNFSINFWWAGLLAGGILLGWLHLWRTSFGKDTADRLWLKVPIIGDISRKIFTSQFIRTMATLLAAGVPITEAITTAGNTVDNNTVRAAFANAREHLLVGTSLSKPLEDSKLFPVMVTRMIGIGEETGNLETMMLKAADFLDVEVDMAIDTFTKMIEPFMIVTVGMLLTFMLLGLYIPLFDLSSVMSGG
jgi:type IV pilus assembly protein PilC